MANRNRIYQSTQEIANQGFDPVYGVPATIGLAEDGSGQLQRVTAGNMALKITVDGSYTYIAYAAPGTPQNVAKWQVRRLDESVGLVITWADGNCDFDNEATDLTALTYI